ncbi:MAG: septum formation initiator family protein [Deltaproteobacteria bacterium]|nr:MAG: septum formation initiator family protein [Deltaproteobacteria bacterium]
MAGSPAKVTHPDGGRINFWPLAVVALILGFAFFGDRGILYMLKLSGQKADLVQKITDVESDNQALRGEIDSLRGDRRYIERVARTELGMVRDDELVFQFSDRK